MKLVEPDTSFVPVAVTVALNLPDALGVPVIPTGARLASAAWTASLVPCAGDRAERALAIHRTVHRQPIPPVRPRRQTAKMDRSASIAVKTRDAPDCFSRTKRPTSRFTLAF